MDSLLHIVIFLVEHLAEVLIFLVLYFVITLPFAYFKYVFDKEKPFLATWFDYAVSFERFWIIFLRLLLVALLVALFFITL